jgi:hypothetical protein
MPKTGEEVMIAAMNSLLLAYDNLSSIPLWLSDLFSSVATGIGLSKRKFYVNDEEILFKARRPVLYTSIEEVAQQEDLVDRCMLITLPQRDQHNQLPDEDVERNYVEMYPLLLGALYDAVSIGLRRLSKMSGQYSRMASFDRWIQACEPAIGCASGTFKKVYYQNKDRASTTIVESSYLAQLLCVLMDRLCVNEQKDVWEGSATALLQLLNKMADEQKKKEKVLPKSEALLSGKLNRLAPNLRKAKFIDVRTGVWRDRRKLIVITRLTTPSHLSENEELCNAVEDATTLMKEECSTLDALVDTSATHTTPATLFSEKHGENDNSLENVNDHGTEQNEEKFLEESEEEKAYLKRLNATLLQRKVTSDELLER